MTFAEKLENIIRKNNSLVCVGLDPDLTKLPEHIKLLSNPLFEFNKAIIDATAGLACAYKPNSAFYEASGANGIEQLKMTCDYINDKYPEVPIILDAKRADIGNTNIGYAEFAFDYLKADGLTVHPYMGGESLEPLLAHKDKGIIVLCRTSNLGAGEFQDLEIEGKKLYQVVAKKVANDWNKNKNCLLVVGATYPSEIAEVRQIIGQDMIILVPGIGAQGGELEATLKAGLNQDKTGLMISASRSIIYASNGADFAVAARDETHKLRDEINIIRGDM
jgi:orotidine-5'-phosphate decarboxylase